MRRLIYTLLLSCAVAGASAQVASPAAGYLLRAEQMLDDGNYRACLDQLSAINAIDLNSDGQHQRLWLRAVALYRSGDHRATEAVDEFLEAYPASIHRNEARLMAGNLMLGSSAAEAYKIYKTIDIKALDKNLAADLNYHTAYAQMRLGEFDNANRRFIALAQDPKYGSNADFYRGYIAYSTNDYEAAKLLLDAANRSALPGSTADYYLAQINYAEGLYDKALEYAKSTIEAPAGDKYFAAEANRIAGLSLFELGKESEAIPYLNEYVALAEEPELSALYVLGLSEYRSGNYTEAVDRLEAVTADDSAMGQSAYLYVGEALMHNGQKDAALMAFDKALRMNHDSKVQEAAYYNFAVAKFGGANIPFGNSIEIFEEYLRRYPSGSYAGRVQEYLVSGYLSERNYEAALASINGMKKPGAKVLAAKQQVLYALGARTLAAGNAEQARDYLNEAATLASHNRDIAYQTQLALGEAQYKLGNYDAAAKAIDNYLSQAPRNDVNRPVAYYDLGYVNFAKKDYTAAADNFGQFVAAPGSLGDATVADALNRIADTHFYAERFNKALAYYDKAFEKMPAAGDYPLFQRGIIHGYKREYKSKIEVLNSLLSKFPTTSLAPEALLEMTEGHLRLGHNNDAVATYRQLIDAHPTTAQGRRAYVELALTLLNSGDRQGAIATYREVISHYPTSDEARLATEELQRLSAEDGTLGEFAEFLASVENAPQLDIAESDRLSYEVAEQSYLSETSTTRLEKYLTDYPSGAYRAKAYSLMMEAAQEAGNTRDVLTYASTIVSDYPDSRTAERALMVKAQSEHSLGMGSEALASWSELEKRSSSPAMLNTARVGIMRVARDLADYPRVVEAADALLSSSTLGAEARSEAIFSKAQAQSLSGDTTAAREGWKQIAENTDDIHGTKSAFFLAESYYNEANYDEARKLTDALIASGTPHSYWLARAFILLSDIFVAQDKKFEAREYLRSLKENYPGDETDISLMIESRLEQLK